LYNKQNSKRKTQKKAETERQTNEITVAALQYYLYVLCLLCASVLIFSMLMQFNEVHLRLRSIEATEDRPACPFSPIIWIQTQSTEFMLEANGSLSY